MSDQAIPAATLVVVRDSVSGPPELLMVKRSRSMAFAGGAIVFPGGRIDAADQVFGRGFEMAARVAAIRETLEESAIPVGLSPPPSQTLSLALQQELHDGKDFFNLLKERELTLDLDALVPFARWKPAFKHARIFDTLFLLARAPAGDWLPRAQAGECEDAFWITAAEALARVERGAASAIFPTKRNLERLARFSSFDAAVADAANFPIETITPWVEEIDGQPHVRIPEGLGYPVTAEPLATAFRA
jgi:8-oxo-dGTP pyrophosphatase MutT (NUDIX family)